MDNRESLSSTLHGFAMLIFWAITIVACAITMFKTSFVVGSAALVACVLCYVGATYFMNCLILRHKKEYRAIHLLSLVAIALFVIAIGLMLMMWSSFSIHAFSVEIGGVTWALLGVVSAVAMVKREDVLSRKTRTS
jgi:hypothetical protein